MNYMEKFPIRVEVRLDNEMRDQLQEKVLKLGISTSAYIRMIISETLNPNTRVLLMKRSWNQEPPKAVTSVLSKTSQIRCVF